MSENIDATPETPQTLLWAEYPDGRYGAVVQSDGRAVYFGVQKLDVGQEIEPASRWVWVRNLRPAPLLFASPDGDGHRFPLVPEAYCRRPAGGPPLDLAATKILWFEQGLGAILVERDQILAILPPQPPNGLPGYSADCQRACSVALPLDDDDLYSPLAAGLADYWSQWTQASPSEAWRSSLRATCEPSLGRCEQEFAKATDQWPPLRIWHLGRRHRQVLLTAGLAVRCQPMVERELLNFREHQRFELGFELPPDFPRDQIPVAAERLASLAGYPWYHETCFLPNHTIATRPPRSPVGGASAESEKTESEKVEVVSELTRGPAVGRVPLKLPNLWGQPVNLWWLQPLPRL